MHEQAMHKPLGIERHIVMLMQAAHDLIDEGYAGEGQGDAITSVLLGIRALADSCDVGRLNRHRLREFVDYSLSKCR